jgi:DNA-binding SARP family transcriptional activator
MQVRVLGSVSITDPAGRTVAHPERKARGLLTLLVLRSPAAVTLDELIDLLWDAPPESALKTARAHVSRLRATLQSARIAGNIERSGNAAYRLVLPPGTTDVDVVGDLRRHARELLGDGRADSAASVLADARRLWRGDPELPDTTTAAAITRGWQREHRQLVLEHLHCVVEGADPSRALGELERHVATDPTDEPMSVLHVRDWHAPGTRPTLCER